MQASQKVVISTLVDRLGEYAVQEQVTVLLRSVRGDAEQWKKYSRQFVDGILPLLSSGATEVRGVRALQAIHCLFENVAPAALRPAKILLRCMFDALCPNIKVPAYVPLPGLELKQSRSLYSWLPAVLVIMKVLRTTKEAELLSGLLSILKVDSDQERARAFLQALFDVILLVGRHFTHPTTPHSDVLSQQFAQLLQFVYGLVDNCGQDASSVIFAAAREVAVGVYHPLDELMGLVIYSDPLIAVYWYQLCGRLNLHSMTTPSEGGANILCVCVCVCVLCVCVCVVVVVVVVVVVGCLALGVG